MLHRCSCRQVSGKNLILIIIKSVELHLGTIPMRHLVYRVQPLPESLLPLVWDFGKLKSGSTLDAESKYIKRMIEKFVSGHLGIV